MCWTCYSKQGKGKNHPRWTGKAHLTRRGYKVRINENGKKVYVHREVWEQYHNQSLPKGWIVHHLNGIKADNRPKNLMAMPPKRHNVRLQFEPYEKRIRELEGQLNG